MNSSVKSASLFCLTLLGIAGGAGYLGARWFSPHSNSPAASTLSPLDLSSSNGASNAAPPGSLFGQIEKPSFTVLSVKGKPEFKFKADQVNQSMDGTKTLLTGLKQAIYFKEGKPLLEMSAGGAQYEGLRQELSVTGGVQVSGPKGLHFYAPGLTLSNVTRELVCPGPIRLQTSQGWVTGSRLKADLKKQTFTLEQVDGELLFTEDTLKKISFWRSAPPWGSLAASASFAVALPFLVEAAAITAPSEKPRQPRHVEVHSDTFSGPLDGEVGVRTLIGHVHLIESDTHFYADRVNYDTGAHKGEAVEDPSYKGGSVGRPHVQDDLHTLTADRMTWDFSSKEPSRKVASAVGNVVFVAQPKPGDAKAAPGDNNAAPSAEKTPAPAGTASDDDKKKERLQKRVKETTTLTCDRLDYYYRSKRGVATGTPKVVQGKRWLTGDQAIYYGRYDVTVINGSVKGKDEAKGDTFASDTLKINSAGDIDTVEASRFQGTFTLDEEEETPEDNPEDRPAALPGSPATGTPAPSKTLPTPPENSVKH